MESTLDECLEDKLTRKIKVLHDTIWENRANQLAVDNWLDNFNRGADAAKQRLHALYLLSHFIYFGSRQMRALLKSMFRDLFKYPIVEEIRKSNGHTTDTVLIANMFEEALHKTRFLGIGNPSESGSHLLYYYRQENGLAKNQFMHTHELFKGRSNNLAVRDPSIERLVFIDDFCGSGQQGIEYSNGPLQDLKSVAPNVTVAYHVLFATSEGMEKLRSQTLFRSVECVYELDDSFKCFSTKSRHFSTAEDGIDRGFVEQMCQEYGTLLRPDCPLGYGACQLLLGFHHNTPDNTLPIIWYDEPGGFAWSPIFRRYPKYGWGQS
jgi:hypothetical protein